MDQNGFLERATQALDKRSIRNAIKTLQPNKAALLSKSLNHLYSIATCSDGCRSGNHVLEAIVGRCFNHSLGSLRMISDNLYDESLNLTRSIAEATNLLFLFNEDQEALEAWKAASRRERLDKFGPGVVRRALHKASGVIPVSDEAYRELCEVATHVTPETRPNNHDDASDRVGYLGGIFQASGHSRALESLLLYCSLSSMVSCKMFGHEERLEELARLGEGTFDA